MNPMKKVPMKYKNMNVLNKFKRTNGATVSASVVMGPNVVGTPMAGRPRRRTGESDDAACSFAEQADDAECECMRNDAENLTKQAKI